MKTQIKLKLYGYNQEILKDIPVNYQRQLGYKQTKLQTDSEGFITFSGFNNNNNNIYFLGDSFVECSYVNEGERLSDQINHILWTNSYDFSIYNAGMSGSSLLGLFNLFINKIINIKQNNKAYLFIFPGPISASCNYFEETYWNKITGHSIYTDDTEKMQYTEKPKNNFLDFERLVKLFIKAAAIFQYDITFCTVPYSPALIIERQDLMNERLRNLSDSLGFKLFDMEKLFQRKEECYYDPLHLNAHGCKYYGSIIFEYIHRNIINQNREI